MPLVFLETRAAVRSHNRKHMNLGEMDMTSKPLSFIVLTYLWTWFFWGLLVATGLELTASTGTMVLFGLGGIGPMVSALWFLFKVETPQTRAVYWRRLCDPRLIGFRKSVV